MFAKTLTIRKSKTAAGERVVPLTDVAASALTRLRVRAEGVGPVEPSHYVFAAIAPKFSFNDVKEAYGRVPGFIPTRNMKSWRSAWRTLTERAGLRGFRFHDLRHSAITQLAENGASDSTIMAIAGNVSHRMLERYSHVRMEAKRSTMEALAATYETQEVQSGEARANYSTVNVFGNGSLVVSRTTESSVTGSLHGQGPLLVLIVITPITLNRAL